MHYREYQNSRDLAWEILIRENVASLPVMVGQLCHRIGIRVRYFRPEGRSDGYCTIVGGQPVIFVSDVCSVERQRFTAAHELGHILLGHVGKYQLVNREPDPEDNPIEQAANVFASRLLAPAVILWALDARTPEEIGALCKISHQAAAFRAERMAILFQRNKFLASPLERQVYAQFTDFIAGKRAGD